MSVFVCILVHGSSVNHDLCHPTLLILPRRFYLILSIEVAVSGCVFKCFKSSAGYYYAFDLQVMGILLIH
ncbi:hypothetical protein L1987_23083 [Smallanthus sonchifolius]|uniref:Uncharacterized protein n=1 Tax=Smallanthus sonchifolius TaxID=185202 RepID=A0ACB9IFY0_9ASTR|nr:hypothetical protein L1987_23083 [Smallanthus sonchifolius]